MMEPIRTLSFERQSRILEGRKSVHIYGFNLILGVFANICAVLSFVLKRRHAKITLELGDEM